MEPPIHFLVPFVALLFVCVKPRMAFLISFLAVVPDFDVFFFVHRSVSHSLVIVLCVMTPLLLWVHLFKRELSFYAVLAFFSIASHLALDVFGGYTPILWPFYDHSVWIQVGLAAHIGSAPTLAPCFQLLSTPTTFQHFTNIDAPLFSGESLIVSTVMLTPVLLNFFKMWRRRETSGYRRRGEQE